MKKRFFLLQGLILLSSGCQQKEWWEDCYRSEEEAHIDQLECDLADLKEKLKSKFDDLESDFESLESKVDDIGSTVDDIELKLIMIE